MILSKIGFRQHCVFALTVVLLILSGFASLAASLNLVLGNPSAADAKQPDNYLLDKQCYALSYNNSQGVPNWVAWRLSLDDLGDVIRKDSFAPDMDLPAGFKRVTPSDYIGSGFDKGHQTPFADRSSSEESAAMTFKMSNMLPQSPILNRKAWEQLESYCRSLVKRGKVLYIVCGPLGQGGIGQDLERKTVIGKNKVRVPEACWKVILIVDKAMDPIKGGKRTTADFRLIAVVMPNDMTPTDWSKYRVSVKSIENLTKLKFYSKLPESIMGPLKESVDNVRINNHQ